MKQFFFKQLNKTGAEFLSSVNPEYIVRSVEYYPGCLMIQIDDLHSELQKVEMERKNGGRTEEYRDIDVMSEIFLNAEDSERFKKMYETDEAHTFTQKVEKEETTVSDEMMEAMKVQ